VLKERKKNISLKLKQSIRAWFVLQSHVLWWPKPHGLHTHLTPYIQFKDKKQQKAAVRNFFTTFTKKCKIS